MWTPSLLVWLCLVVGTSAAIEDSLTGYWSFDGSTADIVGRSHGQFKGGRSAMYIDSLMGQAVRLNGERGYIEIVNQREDGYDAANISPLNFDMTLSVWIRAEGKSGNLLFTSELGRGLSYEQPGYVLGGGHRIPKTLTVSSGEWAHIVVVNDVPEDPFSGERAEGRMYVNGVLVPPVGLSPNNRTYEGGSDAASYFLGGLPGKVPLFQGAIDELATWSRALTEEEIRQIHVTGTDGGALQGLFSDVDMDGMPDIWEENMGLSVGVDDSFEDLDGDGLSNLDEFRRSMNPKSNDTDGDQLSDSVESDQGLLTSIEDPGTSPIFNDSDNDGLSDFEEVSLWRGGREVDPNLSDTDGDGFTDGEELRESTDPTNPNSKPILANGLKAYWTFDDNLEATVGEWNGVAGPEESEISFSEGVFGGALELEGGSHVRVDSEVGEFAFTDGGFSISCWAKLSDWETGTSYFVLTQGTGRPWHIAARVMSFDPIGGWDFYVPRGPNLTETSPQLIVTSDVKNRQWQHLAFVYRSLSGNYGGQAPPEPEVYVNGWKVPSSRSQPLPRPSNMRVTGFEREDLGLLIGSFAGAHPSHAWQGSIDDLAIWERPLQPSEVASVYRSGIEGAKPIRDLIALDGDFDGLPDSWERLHGLDPTIASDNDDPDLDTLSNIEEFALGTSPVNQDTDGDGYSDGVETSTGVWLNEEDTGTHPVRADSDRDGLPDGKENPDQVFVAGVAAGSDPNQLDTDGDGIDDEDEWTFGSNPADSSILPHLGQALMAYWPLEGNTTDRGPTGYDGEARGLSPVAYEPGHHGMSVALNGLDQMIEITGGSEDDFDLGDTSYTISLWYKARALQFDCSEDCLHDPALISKGRMGTSLTLGYMHQRLRFQSIRGAGTAIQYDEIFHHVVGTVDRKSEIVSLYLDGELLAIEEPSVFANENRVYIGGHPPVPVHPGDESSGDQIYWSGNIDDVAIWNRILAPSEILLLTRSDESVGILAGIPENGGPIDTDGDGMVDTWEVKFGFDPERTDGDLDADRDGLTNLAEFVSRTDPRERDTDRDGLLDGVETMSGLWRNAADTGTDPLVSDSDGDGLLDGYERPATGFIAGESPGSDPNSIDTDSDGFTDDVEMAYGISPISPEESPELSTGVKAYWPMDGDFLDYGPQIFDGIPTNDSEIAFQIGRYGKAARFDGKQSIEIVGGDESDFDFTDKGVSISLWFQADVMDECESCNDDLALVSKGIGFDAFNVSLKDGLLASNRVVSGEPLSIGDGVMHHAVISVDLARDSITLFLDGSVIASQKPNIFNLFGGRLYFGEHKSGTPNQLANVDRLGWNGLLDDVMVWERPLLPREVKLLYESAEGAGALAEIDPFSLNPTMDSDSDGASDIAEFFARTNPLDPSDSLRITRIVRHTDRIRIQWASRPRVNYFLEYSGSVSPDEWQLLSEVVPSQGDSTNVEDFDSSRIDDQDGYYRVRVAEYPK